MIPLRKFEEFLKKGIIKKQSSNKNISNDLISESERKFNSLKNILDKIGIDDENANDIIEYCYDILIKLIRAKMLLQGFSSSGVGAHEAEVSYLRNLGFLEEDVNLMNQLRYFRNGIMYYGKRFDKKNAEKILKFLRINYKKLMDLISKK